MATPKYSLMDRFDSDTESIESYLERVAIYFRAIRVEVRQMTGRTLACVLIQLEGWLDKTRVEIVALDCSGCGN